MQTAVGPVASNVAAARNHRMQVVSCLLVVLNIVFMSCALHVFMDELWEQSTPVTTGDEPTWVTIGDAIFATLFALELAVRLKLEGRAFFLVRWNVFDAI